MAKLFVRETDSRLSGVKFYPNITSYFCIAAIHTLTNSELVAIQRSSLVKRLAADFGFSLCGISKAGFLEDEAHRLDTWLSRNHHGKMEYMANHFDLRLDPTKLVEGAKSVVSLVYNYFPEKELESDNNFKISKYAYGEDYHLVLKDKLKLLWTSLSSEIGEIGGRVFVDSAPVLEKAWAAKSGLGWVGKNSNLINPRKGSFFFLCELILDLELAPDHHMKDYCGTCTRCLDACPTQAIIEPYVVDGSRCISYLTIELKEEIPDSFRNQMDDWMFGCDVCQDVCPWNRFSVTTSERAFYPNESLQVFRREEWLELSGEVFKAVFRRSAVKRTKFEGLKRNISFISQSPNQP